MNNHLNRKIVPPKRSSICEARQKLSWEVFPYLLDKLNESLKPTLDQLKWKGHFIYAIDGSLLQLPHSSEITSRFPDVGNQSTRTHYPKARVVLSTHVLSGIPKSLRIDDQFIGERELLQSMLCEFEKDSILLLDRGFDGVASLKRIAESNKLFLCRLRSDLWSSEEVYNFVQSRCRETVVTLKNKHNEEIKVRLLKYKKDRNGKYIVIATNLFNKKLYSMLDLCSLYKRRWDIETSYYKIKKLFNVEKFHSKNLNGVLQEIWASLIVLGMNSFLILSSWPQKMKELIKSKKTPNFKSSSLIFEKYFTRLLFSTSQTENQFILNLVRRNILSITFMRQTDRRNPRISKQPLSTWIGGRKNKPKNKLRKGTRRGIYA